MQFVRCPRCRWIFHEEDYEMYICPRANETEHCPICFPCECTNYAESDYSSSDNEFDDESSHAIQYYLAQRKDATEQKRKNSFNFDNCLQQYLTQCDDCGLVYDKRKDYCLLCGLNILDYNLDTLHTTVKRETPNIHKIYQSKKTIQSDLCKCICIETTVGDIFIGIDQEQQCCENWGIKAFPKLSDCNIEGNRFIDLRIDERDEVIKEILDNFRLKMAAIISFMTVSIYTLYGRIVVVIWTQHGYYPHKYISKFGKIQGDAI